MEDSTYEGMLPWYVYILRCADGTLYTGITNDVEHRLASHNRGQGAKYTRTRLPVGLAYLTEVEDRSAASRLEGKIKRLSRAGKLDLIRRAVPGAPLDTARGARL